MTEQEWVRFEEALASLREQEADALVYAEVRARAVARVRRERRLRWSAAAAIAASIVMAAGMWTLRRGTAPATPAPAPVVETRPAPAPLPVPEPPVVTAAVHRPPPRAKTPPPVEPMKIHLTTDDPNIVIIWLVGDEKGGAD